jgi:rubrerythrin
LLSKNPLGIVKEISPEDFDREALRLSIIAEYDAISLYEQLADGVKNPGIKKVLLNIAREEKVHVGELELLLSKADEEHFEAIKEGGQEASKLAGGE